MLQLCSTANHTVLNNSRPLPSVLDFLSQPHSNRITVHFTLSLAAQIHQHICALLSRSNEQ